MKEKYFYKCIYVIVLTWQELRDDTEHPDVGENPDPDPNGDEDPIGDSLRHEGQHDRDDEELETGDQVEEAVAKVVVVEVRLHDGRDDGLFFVGREKQNIKYKS